MQPAHGSLTTLRYLWLAPQDSLILGSAGYRGFFYHFLEPETGHRFRDVELSTMDTALLVAGALFCKATSTRARAREDSIRLLAEVDLRASRLAMGAGATTHDCARLEAGERVSPLRLAWLQRGAAPAHSSAGIADPPGHCGCVASMAGGISMGVIHEGQEHLGFAPLFGHQYTHGWIDFRGIADRYMRERGIDYFENSRRAVYAQRAYAMTKPMGWSGYGERCWGLTACDGPIDRTSRSTADHGSSAPTGRAELRSPRSMTMGRSRHLPLPDRSSSPRRRDSDPDRDAGEVWNTPLLEVRIRRCIQSDAEGPNRVHHGKVDPGLGWFDTDYLGIDQGPILDHDRKLSKRACLGHDAPQSRHHAGL